MPEGRVLRLRPARPPGYASATLEPSQARWEPTLGAYVLDREDVAAAEDPHAAALAFARSAVRHSCGWDPALSANVEGWPPPVNRD